MNLKLNSSIGYIKGVGEKYSRTLKKHNLLTVFDLLLNFPAFYIDFNNIDNNIEINKKKVYKSKIRRVKLTRNFKKRLSTLKVDANIYTKNKLNSKLQQKCYDIQIVIFNKPYLFDLLKKNENVYFFGNIENSNGYLQVKNPMIFNTIENGNVMPVYTKISTIKSGFLRKIFKNIFESLDDNFENLPEQIVSKYSFRNIVETLKNIHFPEIYDENSFYNNKKRFIYEEFLFFQIELQFVRRYFKKNIRINNYTINNKLRESIKQRLQFHLTSDQIKVYEEVVNDLKSTHTMQRLLQGDVGSGKTIVSFLTLLIAKINGFQGAFLVPTEILANQHFLNAKAFFKNIEIEIITGSIPNKKKTEIKERLKKGEIDIIFGTHSILNESIEFKNLSMIIIDEQQRFGVSQRAALFYKGKSVDLLVTTATPIPRTMLLTLYNDLKVSKIINKPKGRKPIITKIVETEKRDSFYRWLKTKIEKGEKTYIVLPLIEKSDFFSQLHSIEEDSEYFKEIFKPFQIGIISGKTSNIEKTRTLNKFINSDIKILVSTTVIEVGINVKDATIIVIENADRYGLSQLHQLRGRVGRSNFQSYCYIIPSQQITENGEKRLEIISSTNDGFNIAEMDLRMRGGGMISGFEQSGYLDFKVADTKRDYEILKLAKIDAEQILKNPSLQNNYITNNISSLKEKIKKINFS